MHSEDSEEALTETLGAAKFVWITPEGNGHVGIKMVSNDHGGMMFDAAITNNISEDLYINIVGKAYRDKSIIEGTLLKSIPVGSAQINIGPYIKFVNNENELGLQLTAGY